ncbi:OPT/YSL family transporter [bacterium]|nr:OPT/YSL family transporter [bacterium]MBU4361367.1 OPT/YSL family transporter [bacterium]MBU4603113.1 OPT/YSL family transporter [bacterium]
MSNSEGIENRVEEWKPKIPKVHPKVWEPATLIFGIIVAILGVMIGCELITRVGITPNTSVIGAIVALLVARIPITFLSKFRDVHKQNLLQTVISAGTFIGGNCILLPIGILWLFGKIELVPVMFLGAVIGSLISMTIIYKVFDTPAFPADGIWPPGVATAETIIAGDVGGKRAINLLYGGIAGGVGTYFGIPMDIFGVCWIGNIWALTMFAVGLLIRGYSKILFNQDLMGIYLPHGLMIGAGLVALYQIIKIMTQKKNTEGKEKLTYSRNASDLKKGFGAGFGFYLLGAIIIAFLGGLYTKMSTGQLIGFLLFTGFATIAAATVVGLAAMHAGWFPGFATALIFLVLGIVLGFPPLALCFMVGYIASIGGAYADMGYDLKAGWILRGKGANPAFEMEGRKQQYWAELLGLIVAAVFVLTFYKGYFTNDLFPPVSRVFVTTINAGTTAGIAKWLLIWAIPGAIIQFIGGPKRQLGILLATGLLINYPIAGWTAVVALITRAILLKKYGKGIENPMYILAGGFIAGSAIVSFGTGTIKALVRKV